MYDCIRIACAVPDIQVGNTAYNRDRIIDKIKEADIAGTDILIFPELSLTGYTCGDLFFQASLIKSAEKELMRITELSAEYSLSIVLGTPVEIGGQLYNCAVLISGGEILGVVPKTFIPNYNEYYEKRWFSSSSDLKVPYINCSPDSIFSGVPVGRDLIFNLCGGVKVGIEICEDLWSVLPPSTFCALGGAELILNISASNDTIKKRTYRRELVCTQSARCICAYAYVSAGRTESTTDLIFSGHSIISSNGVLIKENEKQIDNSYLMIADVDLGIIRSDRMKNKTFKDSVSVYGVLQPMREVLCYNESSRIKSDGSLISLNKYPFVPNNKNDRISRCLEIFEMQVGGLLKRLEATGCRPVVGVSGGLDSTLALLVSVEAVRRLGREASDVIGITMPCFGTTGRTYSNSVELMKTLGITVKEINIEKACLLHFDDIAHDADVYDLTYENCQARERTQVLMDYAGSVRGLVVGTGDLSELALGWCTYNADHMSMYGVNASIPKTLVRWMIDSIAEFEIFPNSTDVLRDVMDTPISPELLPPDENGKISQETESIVGPYVLHDFFLYYMLRYGYEPEKIYVFACRAFNGDFSSEEILKWMKNFYRRFFTQQFKRSCLPDGVKVGSICLSPRGDWRMPSDAVSSVWLEALENL